MNKVTIERREQKYLDKLNVPLKLKIKESIACLADDAKPNGCIKLTNAKDVWRIRVGHYRIGYQIGESEVNVIRIADRNSFYPKGASH